MVGYVYPYSCIRNLTVAVQLHGAGPHSFAFGEPVWARSYWAISRS